MEFQWEVRRRESELIIQNGDLKVRITELEEILTKLRSEYEKALASNESLNEEYCQRELMLEARITELHEALISKPPVIKIVETADTAQVNELEQRITGMKEKANEAELYYEGQLLIKENVT